MNDLIEYIAKSLVDHPDQVQVKTSGGGDRVRLELSVAQGDMGRIIGKSGKVANAIRTVLGWQPSGRGNKPHWMS